MKPVWELSRQEANAEAWAMLERSRVAGEAPPTSRRYGELGIATQTLARLRTIAGARRLSMKGTRSALVRRICEDLDNEPVSAPL